MQDYIKSIQKRFHYYQELGSRTIRRLQEDDLFWQPNAQSNSIAVIINHLHGNMLSRWTNFFTEDGEKEWRDRDAEFEDLIKSKTEALEKWQAGWQCVFSTIDNLSTEDLQKTILIRLERHSVIDAINRQLSHYAYHIGQIVFIAKMIQAENWQSLTIPKGQSKTFNKMMRDKAK